MKRSSQSGDSELLFKFVGDFPLAVFNTDSGGNVRVPDGKEIFDLRQAARRLRCGTGDLRDLFNEMYGELMPSDTAQQSTPGPDDELFGDFIPDRLALEAFKARFCRGFDDEHIRQAIAVCRALAINPWASDVRFELRMESSGRLELQYTIHSPDFIQQED
jgi:hypothetical protein